MQGIGKSNVKISNRLEKYMASAVNRNILFIASMWFMNPSPDALVKNLSDDFKYLSQKFNVNRVSKAKMCVSRCASIWIDNFEKFFDNKSRDVFFIAL